MKLTIYHGSDHIITDPDPNGGNLRNDYGRGFYCTENLPLAKEWACKGDTNGFANEYTLDMDGLSVLDLNDDNHSILNWLAVLTEHRTYWQRSSIAEQAKEYIAAHFAVDLSGYDLIRGYRADDSYFSFAQDFVAGTISLAKLREAMHLGKLGEQIVLKSERAYENLHFQCSHFAAAEEYYQKKAERDRSARRSYRQIRTVADAPDQIYILDIMREEMTSDDPRLR